MAMKTKSLRKTRGNGLHSKCHLIIKLESPSILKNLNIDTLNGNNIDLKKLTNHLIYLVTVLIEIKV